MKQLALEFFPGAAFDANDGSIVIEALREAAEMCRGSDEMPDQPLKRYVLDAFADQLEGAI